MSTGGVGDEEEESSDVTSDVDKRWVYTNDIIAASLLASLPVLLVFQSLGYLPQLGTQVFLTYGTIVSLAAIWAFGHETVKALKKLRK